MQSTVLQDTHTHYMSGHIMYAGTGSHQFKCTAAQCIVEANLMWVLTAKFTPWCEDHIEDTGN